MIQIVGGVRDTVHLFMWLIGTFTMHFCCYIFSNAFIQCNALIKAQNTNLGAVLMPTIHIKDSFMKSISTAVIPSHSSIKQ